MPLALPSPARLVATLARAAAAAPARGFENHASTSLYKSGRPLHRVFASAMCGGALLSAGCTLAGTAAVAAGGGGAGAPATPAAAERARFAMAIVFPVGLASILFCRADLVTSAFSGYALPLGAAPLVPRRVAALWAATGAGNAAGALLAAGLAGALGSGGSDVGAWAARVAKKKCALTPEEKFAKAIGANALVNVAVVSAAAARSRVGAALALWPPIFAFVYLGLEHSVANAYILPLGATAGGPGAAEIAANLGPVVAGNLVGALLVVAARPAAVRLAALAAAHSAA